MARFLKKIKYLYPNIAYFPQLQKYVNHGFSWGKGAGNMQFSFGDPVEVRKNVQKFLEKLNMGDIKDSINMITEQGDRIVDIDEKLLKTLKRHRFGMGIRCDAFFTKLANITLTLKPGDCTTAIVYALCANKEEVIGLVHSGRLGAERKLPKKAIEHLVNNYHCSVKNIKLGILPHLSFRKRKFEHLDTFKDLKVWKGFIHKKGNFYLVSEEGLVFKQYKEAGIEKENFFIYDIDTFTAAQRGETFSHKYHYEMGQKGREVPVGRYIVAVRRINK